MTNKGKEKRKKEKKKEKQRKLPKIANKITTLLYSTFERVPVVFFRANHD